jgi:hypothetical protein
LRTAGGGSIETGVQDHPDPGFNETLRWQRATGLWLLVALATFYGSFQLWIFSGLVLCGSDTTEPVLSEAVCRDGGLPAITLFIAAPFTPFLVVAIGGPIALRRRDGRLFVMSVLAPPVVLVVSYFVVGALNGW